MNIDAIKDVYGRLAGLYDVMFGPVANFGRKRVVAEVNRLEPSSVLEVGVGTGISLRHYDSRHEISGIDLSAEMLDRAKRRVAQGSFRHVRQLQVMDAQDMAYDDNSFDVVVAMYVMSVVPDPQNVLSEMQRVCRPNGKIFIVNHFSQDHGFLNKIERLLEPYADSLGWRPHFLIDGVLATVGLTVLEQKPVPPLGVFTMLVCENNKA